MDANMLLSTYGKYFHKGQMMAIKTIFEGLNEEEQAMLSVAGFKNPTTALLISIFFGGLALDRFYIGDTTLGILKLTTCGGFGLWAFVDLFLIMHATRAKNSEKLLVLAHH